MTVLVVGAGDRTAELLDLPIELIALQHGSDAVRSFKTEQIDSVISRWHLDDMHDGLFLKRLKSIRPGMPSVALIEPGSVEQEIAARSLGITAVIPDDCPDDYFRTIVTGALKLRTESVRRMLAVKEV